MDRARHRPTKVTVTPGQKWASADRTVTAIVTSIHQVTEWAKEDVTTVSFLRYLPGSEATLEQASQVDFVAAYPTLVG